MTEKFFAWWQQFITQLQQAGLENFGNNVAAGYMAEEGAREVCEDPTLATVGTMRRKGRRNLCPIRRGTTIHRRSLPGGW